jgi:hypothetical protein
MRLSSSTSPPMASSMVTAWGSRPQKPCLGAFWLPGEAPTGRAPPPWAARRGGLQPRTARARQGDPLWVVAPQRDFDGLSPRDFDGLSPLTGVKVAWCWGSWRSAISYRR